MLGNLVKLYVKENERSAGMNMRDERTIKLLEFNRSNAWILLSNGLVTITLGYSVVWEYLSLAE